MCGNQFDALGCQLMIERITVAGTILNKSPGSPHGEGFSECRFGKGDFIWRCRSRMRRERKTRSVCNNRKLRTFAYLIFPILSSFSPP